MVTIATERLLLRPFRRYDAEAFTRLESMTAERAAGGNLFGRLRRALGRSK